MEAFSPSPFVRVGVPMPFERQGLYQRLSTPTLPRSITANTFRADMRSTLQKSKSRREFREEMKAAGKRMKRKQGPGGISLTKSDSFLGYPLCTPIKTMKKKRSEPLIPPTTAARPKLQRDLNFVTNHTGAPHMGALDRTKPPNTHDQAYGFWKEQEAIILGGIREARSKLVIDEHKKEALAREGSRKANETKLKHAAIIEKIRLRNMARRSLKDRMASKQKEKLKKDKLARTRRRMDKKKFSGRKNPHCRQKAPEESPGPGDYDPVQSFNFDTMRPVTASFKSTRTKYPIYPFSFSKRERFGKDVYQESDVPGPGAYEEVNPRDIAQVLRVLPVPDKTNPNGDKTRFRGSIIQYLGPRISGDAYKPSPKGWLYASHDHALGASMPGPNKYLINDEAVRPGTCCGRISTAYPLGEIDIITNRASKMPGPAEYKINDNAIRRSPSFRISTAKPMGYLDWVVKRSKEIPGP
jgi:hypothetical protein